MKKIQWPLLISSILGCELVGIAGTVFTSQAIPSWYSTLTKPVFSPPNWVFGPVWTTLYALMGIAGYLLWTSKKSKQRTNALFAFGMQLALNGAWTPLFFGAKQLELAFIEILLLWGTIAITIRYSWRVQRLAAYLLLPYLAWVSFATLLNGALVWLN